MISIDIDGIKFNYRVAAIILDDEKKKILLNRNPDETHWFIPGGRCELLEFSKDTLKREVREEMGADIEIIKPVFLVENLFPIKDKRYHEIGIYYLTQFVGDKSNVAEEEFIRKDEMGKEIAFKWFALNDLINIDFRPAFLKGKLLNLPENMEVVEVRE